MPESIIPLEIRNFILAYIDSIADLEALLLLRLHPDQTFNALEISSRLYISENDSLEMLERLSKLGFLSQNEKNFKYQPNPDLESTIGRLAEVHAHYLVPLTHFIHSKRKNKIQQFADAFKIRKTDD